jgi:NADP-dependent 3-hydroxy acid dehydrogenase YdfG
MSKSKDKVVAFTGASRGIGEASALFHAEQSAKSLLPTPQRRASCANPGDTSTNNRFSTIQ